MAYYSRIGVSSLSLRPLYWSVRFESPSALGSYCSLPPGVALLPTSIYKEESNVKKLFVGNLPYTANETDVQNFFSDQGVAVDSITVMRDRFTGQARGFGFAEISDDSAAAQAVEVCHGKELMGRTLVVNEARPMAPREGGAGGGRPQRRERY
jgi:RNA recognition motif-containing protein